MLYAGDSLVLPLSSYLALQRHKPIVPNRGVLRIGRRLVFQDGQKYCRRFLWLFSSTASRVQNCKMSNTCFDGIKCAVVQFSWLSFEEFAVVLDLTLSILGWVSLST